MITIWPVLKRCIDFKTGILGEAEPETFEVEPVVEVAPEIDTAPQLDDSQIDTSQAELKVPSGGFSIQKLYEREKINIRKHFLN